ncbi:hypothetical protein Q5H92_17720 [Hymenobacter sp. M29]|uniref:DUF4175 domain-containing protein n=1 Tax=Hymenobacter mellowenesis TaxID=3063995 RepID=A0ABT9AGI0_9BACT|nr:DUF4175 family protein [Hymenobacter sp. M29]MDO7848210.1 hypothetical protein [Hymenobacter sp. M29]
MISSAVDTSSQVAQARQLLHATAKRYALRHAPIFLPLLIVSLICGLVARVVWNDPLFFRAFFLALAAYTAFRAVQLWRRIWLTRLPNAVQTLDRHHPQLEDSTWLLLQPDEELGLLGGLQQQRVAVRFVQLSSSVEPVLPLKLTRWWWQSAVFLLLAAVVWWFPMLRKSSKEAGVRVHFTSAAKPPKPGRSAPPHIRETRLLVTPPAYTRQPAFAPAQASFQCPEGSRVRWLVRVSGAGKSGPVLETGRQRHLMQPVAGQPGAFFIELTLTRSTLYRLRLSSSVSDDYAIDVRADQAPVLRIQTPKPYTLVPAYGQQPEVTIRATAHDDYGLSRTELVITVAQGQGEAVKFHEVRRDLTAALASGSAPTNLRSALNLPRLGLTYGDELYFYLTARDNAGHTARTDAYLVQWQDTAVADSPADLGMGVKVAPAYFRSQRQIIIDTEKLIAEKPRLDAATVASRANALGFDQQTLRLRYGKFMGEEAEAGIGAQAPHSPIAEDEEAPASPTAEAPEHDEHDHAAPSTSPAKTSPTAETDALMEPYIHKHDDSETADFLEPAVKAKLRTVLDQMWAAELRLRTGQLAAARPYEYRALRLLKEVQQQTRVFVKKAGFTPPPLPEATVRLTGELAGAAVPHRQQQVAAPATQPAVRAALRWLAAHSPTQPADARLLDQAGAVLAGAALQRPGVYLPALKALRQLVADVRAGRPACAECRPPVERALTDLLATPAPTPVSAAGPDRLGRRYFQELSR